MTTRLNPLSCLSLIHIFTDLMEYEKVKNVYILHDQMLEQSKENLKVLHPLPRVKEISQDVDKNPKAYYFEQAKRCV